MDITKEQEVIKLCKQDLSHFTKLYEAYVADIYRYCYSKLENKTETEEVVSETFLSALENITKYQFMDRSIKHWLFVIARNIIYKKHRKPEVASLDESWQGAEDDKILDRIANKQMVAKVEELIRKFNPPVPEIIRLKVWEEMSFEEIADCIDKPLSTVKMAYYRAIEKIKVYFEEEGVRL